MYSIEDYRNMSVGSYSGPLYWGNNIMNYYYRVPGGVICTVCQNQEIYRSDGTGGSFSSLIEVAINAFLIPFNEEV